MTLFDGSVPEPEWPEPVIIELRQWEYAHAHDVGIRRFTANWGRKDADAYSDRSRMEADRTASVASTLCELAVARAYNQFFHGHVWPRSEHGKWSRTIADVGRRIEVRRVRDVKKQGVVQRPVDVAIKPHDLDRDLVVVAAYPFPPEFRTVEVWGHIHADEGWEIAEVVYDHYRRVHRKNLTAPNPLRAV